MSLAAVREDHSMIASAVASRVGDTSIQSVFAALRLITASSLIGYSLDHLVGERKQGRRNFQADAPGGFQIEHERIARRLLER